MLCTPNLHVLAPLHSKPPAYAGSRMLQWYSAYKVLTKTASSRGCAQDEQELQQAAAAVARLVPPSTPTSSPVNSLIDGFQRLGRSGRAATSGGAAAASSGNDSGGGTARSRSASAERGNGRGADGGAEDVGQAQSVKELERAVEAAGLDALTFDAKRPLPGVEDVARNGGGGSGGAGAQRKVSGQAMRARRKGGRP